MEGLNEDLVLRGVLGGDRYVFGLAVGVALAGVVCLLQKLGGGIRTTGRSCCRAAFPA